MVFPAALTAVQPNSSQKAPSMASPACRTQRCERPSVCSKPTASEVIAGIHGVAIGGAFRRGNRWGDFGALAFLPSRIPSSARDHASGPFRRPAARRRSASLAAPLRGLGSSQKKFVSRGKRRRTNFFRAPPRKHALTLGAGPTRSLR
jgi:hypothetical protein